MMANNDTSINATGFSQALNYDDGQCAICLGPHADKSQLQCGHFFCYHCLTEWCKVKLECPTCKRPFTCILHNIGSTDGQQIHTPDPSLLGLASHHMRTFALALSDPEFRRGLTRPDIIRQVDDFRHVLNDAQVLQAFDDPAFRTQLNDHEFGRTFDDPEVNRLLGIPEFRCAMYEMVGEVLDDEPFLSLLSSPDSRRFFLADWSLVLNGS